MIDVKKTIVLILTVLICFLFSACKDNTDAFSENETNADESSSQELNVNDKNEDSSSAGSMNLENYTSAYVEPKFKMVSKLAECYDYFETEPTDTVTTEKNDDGSVKLITVKDKDGNLKADMKFTYNDNIIAAATFYGENEKTEKVIFSFYDENSLNIAAHADGESNMSIYFYNKDGSFNSYMDGDGLSTLLSGAVMEGLGNAFS